MAIGLSEESRRALTNVGAHSVLTDLAAHTRRLGTLVDIVTRFAVRHEAVAGTTGADEAGGRVGAIVITVMNGGIRAFIDTYSQKRRSNITVFKASRKDFYPIRPLYSWREKTKMISIFVFMCLLI